MQLYNSLTRQKENFSSIQPKRVHVYVCGITPYDTTHLGHAFTYIAFDILVRFLQYSGYKVRYTQNITDINDRDNDMLQRAKAQNISWKQLAEYWTDRFLHDMSALNWIMPTEYLKASDHIDSMVSLIEEIITQGYGYVAAGSVYLDISKKNDFGKLSRLSKQQMLDKAISFEEDITNPNKRNSLDITLWRASSPQQAPHIPSFESPWGNGRPGWHIECSAMSIESLGKQIDIHGGGMDLIYPHHESEIAQSESATGIIPFAVYWMHTGIMRIAGEKMSKSRGNLILIDDLLKKYSQNAIRWVLLSHHYREPWEYREDDFRLAESLFLTILTALHKTYDFGVTSNFKSQATAALSDDLQTPHVLELISTYAKILSNTQNSFLQRDIKDILQMLGFVIPIAPRQV